MTWADTAVEVRVVAFDDPDYGVRSTVTLEHGSDTATVTTDAQGYASFTVSVCDATTNFRATPKLPYIKTAAYACGNPLVIRARKVAYASVIERALKEVPEGFQGDAENPYRLTEDLYQALDTDAYAAAADAAIRLSGLSPTDPDLRRSFETLAADLSFRALGLEPDVNAAPLISAEDMGELTPLGEAMVLQFQGQAGVPETAEWDARSIGRLNM